MTVQRLPRPSAGRKCHLPASPDGNFTPSAFGIELLRYEDIGLKSVGNEPSRPRRMFALSPTPVAGTGQLQPLELRSQFST